MGNQYVDITIYSQLDASDTDYEKICSAINLD